MFSCFDMLSVAGNRNVWISSISVENMIDSALTVAMKYKAVNIVGTSGTRPLTSLSAYCSVFPLCYLSKYEPGADPSEQRLSTN